MNWKFAILICIPVVEAIVIIELVRATSLMNALLIVFLTGLVGIGLARSQGISLMFKIRDELNAGRMPAPYMIDGVMVLLAAAVLITPGLITDVFGFLLLVPPVRRLVRQWMRSRVERWLSRGGHVTVYRG